MYEAISNEDLINVVGGCGCAQQQQQQQQPAATGAPAPATQPSTPAPSTTAAPSGCEQLMQAITQLLNLFGGMSGGASAPAQPSAGA